MTKTRHALPSDQQGFTLIEIMVTLAVLAIVAVLVSPAIMEMAPNMRLRSAANELHANLMRAKSIAVKENHNIGVSVSTVDCAVDVNGVEDGQAPADAFETNGNGGAYRIFVDDGAGNPLLARNNTWDAGEQILVDINDNPLDALQDLPDSVAICVQDFNAVAPPTTVTTGFTVTGLLQNAFSGRVTLTSSQGDQYRVGLSPAGSVTMEKL